MQTARTPLNLDANACHSLLQQVKEALMSFDNSILNPNSVHQRGQSSRALIEGARDAILDLTGLRHGFQLVFTSGATEANNLAVFGFAGNVTDGRMLSSSVEHPSVLQPLSVLSNRGFEVTLLPPEAVLSEHRQVDLERIRFASLMLANNEIGTVFPIAGLSAAIRKASPRALIHSDAVQALGKLDLDYSKLGVDAFSFSAHKIGGLTGSGALIFREGLELSPQLRGGPQELNLRAGTENVLGIHLFGVAARALKASLESKIQQMRQGRDLVLSIIQCACPRAVVIGDPPRGLPNTLSIRFPGVTADDLVVACDLSGVCISSGAACSSGKPSPSHVLLAHGLSESEARETVRITLEREYMPGELERAAATIVKCVGRMRA